MPVDEGGLPPGAPISKFALGYNPFDTNFGIKELQHLVSAGAQIGRTASNNGDQI
jgi:hypothetical protein